LNDFSVFWKKKPPANGDDVPGIELKHISNYICRDTSLTIREGEMMVLAGATGAGKTTLLNVIAGLIPYGGSVCFGGAAVDDLPPEKRNVGYLFQSFALFPHMTVRENIAYGLKAHGADRPDIDEGVSELLALLNIQHLETRYPKSLSGGEKQRTALARTLAPRPNILLLDEPFNSLDARTAKFIRLEMKRLQKKLGLTAVYVTHNQREAFEMGDRIAVVDKGQVEQVGTPDEILFSPQTKSVFNLFGSPNIFDCWEVQELDFGLATAMCGPLTLVVPYEAKPLQKVAILPAGVHISRYPIDTSVPNRFLGDIFSINRKSPLVYIDIQIEGAAVTAELPETLWNESGLRVSDEVHVAIPLKWIRTLQA
jgi:ABC-type Fe3+/spermidine/putrescine transport system ATPase subunit